MSGLRSHLIELLEKKVRKRGLVVWQDDAREYSDVWSSLVPDGVRAEAFDGSWYELRRQIESAVAGESPPRLVVYDPVGPPGEDDPLAEVRDAGAAFKLRLSTLVKRSLKSQLPAARVADICKNAETLSQAEAAVEGAGDTDVRLVGVLSSKDPVGVLVEVLMGGADERIAEAGAWQAFADQARAVVGVAAAGEPGSLLNGLPLLTSQPGSESRQSEPSPADELRGRLFSHLMLCDLAGVEGGQIPESLAVSWVRPSAAQQKKAGEVLARLRGNADGAAVYRALAADADTRLGIGSDVEWREGLDRVAGTPALEEAAFERSARLLSAGRYREALQIAENRLGLSPWISDHLSGWGGCWRAAEAAARLQAALAECDPPTGGSPEDFLVWYADVGWRVDRAHRRMELARTELRTFGEIEDALGAARAAYSRWLDRLLSGFTETVVGSALDTGDMLRQGEVHDRFVADAEGVTLYVWVDALRYELGLELADALRASTDRVDVHAAVAAAPTITQVGMANLLPGAATGLRLALEGDHIKVSVGGVDANTVPERCSLLRARHGSIADLALNDASQSGEKALKEAVRGAGLILLRSQEVDAAGESGLLSVAWAHFDTTVNLLAGVVARLAQCGVSRVVVSADHGFIALGRDLGSDRTVDAPEGTRGTTKRRVFIGRGGTPNPATVRVPLAACGITGDLDLVVPKGLAVFRAGGGRQFFHGGLSPQELVVPVIVAELPRIPQPQNLEVDVEVAGGRITTGVFAATLAFEGNLFKNQVTVRVVAGAGSGMVVARIVSGDGYDPETGAVTVTTGENRVLTFQVTENLDSGTEVELQVLDIRTGRTLASSKTPVAAAVVVEDRLD